jgi:CMP-N,N'-diacetyllegionaminic acid synthase
MRILGIVAARKGSKRVPGKNVRPLAGKPVCAWVIEAALAARRLDALVVSSDDEEVLAIASRLGAVALPRPAELATDTSPAIDYVRHALAAMEARGGERFDATCVLPAAAPLVTPEDIDGTIALFEATGAETAVSVVEIDHAIHPFKLKVMDGDRLLPWLVDEKGRMAAHELPKIFVRNGAVYVTRRDVVESGRVVSDDQRGYIMPADRSVDLNTELDMKLAEWLLQKRVTR